MSNASTITSKKIENWPSGAEVTEWTLIGAGGLRMSILNYGGIVTELHIPRRDKEPLDVVLGFKDKVRYSAEHPYFGALVGRIAGRVTNGRLKFGKHDIKLEQNDRGNHLHGGSHAFNERLWHVEPFVEEDTVGLKLSLTSKDGDNGYPGEAKISVCYSIGPDNSFTVETSANVTELTPIALTHHSYFNLEGADSSSTHAHEVQILSSQSFETDEKMGFTGNILPVPGAANDANTYQTIESFVPGLWQRHGDLYWLDNPSQSEFKTVAYLSSPNSGLQMQVQTNCTCLQFYGGEYFDGSVEGKNRFPYRKLAGLCFECQGHPEAFDGDLSKGNILASPESPHSSRTSYIFSEY